MKQAPISMESPLAPLTLMLFLLATLIVLAVTPLRAAAQTSSNVGQTQVFYVNGIRATPVSAAHDSIALGLNYVGENVSFRLAYNPTQGALQDVFEAWVQSHSPDEISLFFLELEALVEPDPVLGLLLQNLENSTAAQEETIAKVVNDHAIRYSVAIESGAKVIIVSHSQGNFFANAEYKALTPPEQSCTKVIGVATPASFVAGATPYTWTTLNEDLVASAFTIARTGMGKDTLPPDLSNGPGFEVTWANMLGHAFVYSYLLHGTKSGLKILGDIREAQNTAPPAGSPCAPKSPPPPSCSALPMVPTICTPPAGQTQCVVDEIGWGSGRPISTPVPITFTVTSSNDGIGSTSTDTNPGAVTAYSAGPVCRIDGQWLPRSRSFSSETPLDLGSTCTGEGVSSVSASVALACTVLTVTTSQSLTSNSVCAGFNHTVVTEAINNKQSGTLTIDLANGAGNFSRNDASSETLTTTGGPLGGSSTNTGTLGLTGSGSWSAEQGTPVFPGVGFNLSTRVIPAGAPLPSECQ
jgi:hypothetical protein